MVGGQILICSARSEMASSAEKACCVGDVMVFVGSSLRPLPDAIIVEVAEVGVCPTDCCGSATCLGKGTKAFCVRAECLAR